MRIKRLKGIITFSILLMCVALNNLKPFSSGESILVTREQLGMIQMFLIVLIVEKILSAFLDE